MTDWSSCLAPPDAGDIWTFDEGTLVACGEAMADAVEEPCCAADRLRAFPEGVADVLDLRGLEPGDPGTCAALLEDPFSYEFGFVLPAAIERYPLKVLLPPVFGVDPACTEGCGVQGGAPVSTAFGVGFRTYVPGVTDPLIGGDSGRVLAVSVSPPWRFVSGGCGEACAWTCIEGYQEFGVRSCITMAQGDFGIVTDDPAAPAVEVLMELVDLEGQDPFTYAPGGCCLYSR